MTPPRAGRTGAVALVVALLLAGCSGGEGDAPGAGVDRAPQHAAAADEAAAVEAPSADETERLVIQTGSVSVTADDAPGVASEIARWVVAQGGRVDSRSETAATADETAWASLVVRVPAQRVTPLTDRLAELGTVTGIDLTSQDVTGTAQDLDARIHALEISVDRMESLMQDAGSTKDLLTAESALSDRQAELESLQAQRDRLADQVALSTLEISVAGPGALPATAERGTFATGLATGWDALVSTVAWLLVALGVLLPWLALLAAGTLVVVGLRRRARRRAAPSPAQTPAA